MNKACLHLTTEILLTAVLRLIHSLVTREALTRATLMNRGMRGLDGRMRWLDGWMGGLDGRFHRRMRWMLERAAGQSM